MDDLPSEMIESIFHHLDAFDAHRFGLTQRRAFEVIQSERKLAKSKELKKSQYDYQAVDAHWGFRKRP